MTSPSLPNHIEWSVELDMPDFVDWFREFCPPEGALCLTTVGYMGGDELDQIGSDEIYWIYGLEKQSRIVATDGNDRYLSIPVNYRKKFNILYRGREQYEIRSMILEEAVKKIKSEELEIECLLVENDENVTFKAGAKAENSVQLGQLTFVDIYDEKYLIAFPLADHNIYCKPTVLPVYLPVSLAYATGLKYDDKISFNWWVDAVGKLVKSFPSSPIQMCQEIMMLPGQPQGGDYEYIRPSMSVVDDNKNDCDDDYEEIEPMSYVTISRQADQASSANHPSSSLQGQRAATNQTKYPLPPVPCRLQPRRPSLPGSNSSRDDQATSQPPVHPRHILNREGQLSRRPPPPVPEDVPAGSDHGQAAVGERRNLSEQLDACNNLSEVPSDLDVSSLSVTDVVKCLRLLKMDQYVDIFKANDVDGQLLLSLEEPHLVEMGLTKLHALKLMNFAQKGWRPK